MSSYRRGSKGEEVRRVQDRLKAQGYYEGERDGIFGGGTESAVKRFQRARGLEPDGVVGSLTWAALFDDEPIREPALLREGLAYRCLALTGSFETSQPPPECFCGISGDFDGQGLSFGVLQWNLGQQSLQPLFREMADKHPDLLQDICQDHYPELRAVFTSSAEEQLAWVRSVQDQRRFVLHEPWLGLLKTLGRREEFQKIQVRHAEKLYRQARALCQDYGLWSQRAVALMFDIKVQNGSISSLVRAQIEADFARLDQGLSQEESEQARLLIVANRRAEASNPRWIEDVRRRKLTIARGEGRVHGHQYHLADDFGIRLAPF
ncbi:peptidoglycan-binding domain-containing protein [Geoalkalibacter sp.]|uniref:peptidoglycan-binding domain-containing protein n=1 Tax=Geoalkalibacter sp. TaxID=3041440 RepID=UPI00272DE7E8|nr:peptidoglycan-binding domain-containing protein [Geoalkalibacter sp.]